MVRKSDKTTTRPEAIEVVEVNPTLAEEWLKLRHENERNVRIAKVKSFARDMWNDNWHFIGDTLRFDEHGYLVDGQHRLLAIVESGSTQWFPVLNIPTEARAAIDTGTTRSLGDLLQFGNHVHGRTLAAIVRRLLIHDRGKRGTTEGSKAYHPSNAEGVAFVKNNKAQLHRSVDWALKAARNKLPIPASVVGATYFLAESKDRKQAEEFFEKLVTGLDLQKGEPVAALHSRAEKELARNGRQMHPDDAFRYTIMAWNHTRAGRTMDRLLAPRGGWRKTAPPSVE